MFPLCHTQASLVNSALLKFFLQGEELLSHLHSLRSYFFLLDGDFGSNMTSMLFERMYQAARPVDLLNCVTLNSILSKSLMRPDPNIERLSFGVKYVPPQFLFSSPLLLDCIMLQYKVTWPLNIIFTDAALCKYDDVSIVISVTSVCLHATQYEWSRHWKLSVYHVI
jgi:gamma-tubulin complex component 6